MNNLNQISEIAKGPVFQQVLCFCRESSRPWSTQQLCFLVSPHFSSQRFYHTYMIQSFCTVSGFTWKSTHTCFFFSFMEFPAHEDTSSSTSHLGCRGWQLQTVPSEVEIHLLFWIHPTQTAGSFFISSKCFLSPSAVLWNLISGWQCVHQGTHHTSCADNSPFTGFRS